MKKTRIFLVWFLCFLGIYFVFPYFIDVQIKNIPASTLIYDENKEEIWEVISQEKYRHIQKNIDDIPDFLKKSVIAIEDKRFYYHSGIDYIGIVRAIKNNIFWTSREWASTIENQIIRNNYWLNEKRSYILKIKEFAKALALNKKYNKNEILEMYLNNINFWYMNFWVESASRYYYNKSLKNLTKAEMLWLITIIKNPNKYNPITKLANFNERFQLLLNTLEKNNIITLEEKNEILQEKLTFSQGKKDTLPYVVDFMKTPPASLPPQLRGINGEIQTTINANLTKKIDELAKTSLKTLAWKNVWDYSVIIVDRNSMDLKVMIWGNNYDLENGQVNGSLALRQPGSALKPFLYAIDFKNFWKTPSSTILDLPVSYPTADGNIYEPKNYSLSFAGEVTLAEALSQSINIPAVKILNEIGINSFLRFLKTVGINSLNKDADFYGLSLALWSGEVSLYELTRAYSIFAKWGDFCEINIIAWEKQKCMNILEKKYTDMVEEILTNRYFKLAWFPINSNLDFPDREVFVKTWTSRNFRDNWSIWYTSDFIIWVWVGNKDGSEMKWVSGATWAGDIFRKIVYALDTRENQSNIVNLEKEQKQYVKIISPLDKSVFTYNPSIPKIAQDIKLEISSNIDYDKKLWFLNEKQLENDFINIDDLQEKNILKVELYNKQKKVWNDEVSFEKKL